MDTFNAEAAGRIEGKGLEAGGRGLSRLHLSRSGKKRNAENGGARPVVVTAMCV